MERRDLLAATGLGLLGLVAGCAMPAPPIQPRAAAARSPAVVSSRTAAVRPSAAAKPVAAPWRQGPLTGLHKVAPWKTIIAEVPDANARTVGLTVDDGVSTETLGAYIDLAKATGIRLTFFVNGVYSSWTEHRDALRPLVESGQIQLANHTWDHPDITRLSDARIADEVTRNETFLKSTFGVDPRPYFRPPYFARTDHTDALLAGLGYSVITWWTGSFGDADVLTPAQILANARQYLTANRIVIGHANHLPVIAVMDQIAGLIQDRKLRTVTLADVFTTQA